MNSTFFYKYFSVNQNLYSSIINNELYFSNPRNFNDPFDSYPRFTLTTDVEKIKSFFDFNKEKTQDLFAFINSNEKSKNKLEDFKKLIFTYSKLKLFNQDLYTNEFENLGDKLVELYAFYSDIYILDYLLKDNIEFLQAKIYYDYIFMMIDKQRIGISCGSFTPTCPLMWGHYGDNHKGICIKYVFDDLSYNKNISLEIAKVKYSDEPIKIFDLSGPELENLKYEILSNKYSKWEYENEIRLINQGQGLLKINKLVITEIIFGCKSSTKDRYSIIKLFASLGYKIEKLRIARRLPSQYELSIEEMKMNDIAGSGVYIEELNLNKNFR